jgi:hypothetical protein
LINNKTGIQNETADHYITSNGEIANNPKDTDEVSWIMRDEGNESYPLNTNDLPTNLLSFGREF